MNSKKTIFNFAFTYLVVLGMGLYFAKGIEGTPPAIYSVLAVAGVGLVLNFILWGVVKKNPNLSSVNRIVIFLVFQVLQGGLAFILEKYLFKFSLLASLDFTTGVVLSTLGWYLLKSKWPKTLSALILTVFFALGLAIAMRLGDVLGGMFFGLAVLNGLWLGLVLLEDPEGHLWLMGILSIGLLVVGRAVIQYYLLQTNYATLGVVITHPYTFVGLFAGFLVPFAYWMLEKEKLLPRAVMLILLGILFPFIAGIFIHVRPMAGYLLGLVVGSFFVGSLFAESYGVHLLAYFSLGTAVASLPLLQQTSNLSRVIRLEILGGVMVLMILVFLWTRYSQSSRKA